MHLSLAAIPTYPITFHQTIGPRTHYLTPIRPSIFTSPPVHRPTDPYTHMYTYTHRRQHGAPRKMESLIMDGISFYLYNMVRKYCTFLLFMFDVYIQPYGYDRPFTLLFFTFPIMPAQLNPLLITISASPQPLNCRGSALWFFFALLLRMYY